LKNLLYPECIENSKVISILNLKSLDFKLEEFLNLKEVKKITEDKEEILKAFKEMDFINLSKDNENTFNIKLDEEIKVFSVINIPQKMKKDEILESLKLQNESLLRVYKRSLYWYIVLNSEEAAKQLRYNLERTTFVRNI
jgi:Asp-tRNA(Asn)/Glu-tRNA(Gln) amidotransferase C subunit